MQENNGLQGAQNSDWEYCDRDRDPGCQAWHEELIRLGTSHESFLFYRRGHFQSFQVTHTIELVQKQARGLTAWRRFLFPTPDTDIVDFGNPDILHCRSAHAANLPSDVDFCLLWPVALQRVSAHAKLGRRTRTVTQFVGTQPLRPIQVCSASFKFVANFAKCMPWKCNLNRGRCQAVHCCPSRRLRVSSTQAPEAQSLSSEPPRIERIEYTFIGPSINQSEFESESSVK
jgi:hypothetical protein